MSLQRLNTTWSTGRIVRFIQSCDNPPHLKYKSLHKCVSRILKRDTINNKKRSNRPATITTPEFQKNANKCIRLKKGVSIRKTNSMLKREGFTSSMKTVSRTAKR